MARRGGFATRQILLFIEGYFPSSVLDFAAGVCFWVTAGALGGAGMVFHLASEESKQQALQDFLRPLNIVKNQFGNINVQGNAAIGNQDSQIVQNAHVSVEIQQQIHSFIDRIKGLPASELPEDHKREAISHLHTLDYQCMLPPARRDLSKVVTALQRLPALCSGIATCFEAWQKVEAVVKPHLGF